jgi:hypothetical protein
LHHCFIPVISVLISFPLLLQCLRSPGHSAVPWQHPRPGQPEHESGSEMASAACCDIPMERERNRYRDWCHVHSKGHWVILTHASMSNCGQIERTGRSFLVSFIVRGMIYLWRSHVERQLALITFCCYPASGSSYGRRVMGRTRSRVC